MQPHEQTYFGAPEELKANELFYSVFVQDVDFVCYCSRGYLLFALIL